MTTSAAERPSWSRAFALVLGVLALPSVLLADTPIGAGTWKAADCADFGLSGVPATVECGYVVVPRRHADPSGPALELATVVIRAPSDGRAPDPVFVAQGGPGGSSIAAFAQALIDDPDMWLSPNRDHVVWDQRGTLYSRPALLCPEVTAASLEVSLETAPADPDPDPEALAYRACRDRLALEAGDLSAFNTVENADDIEAIRLALGYERINYYGVSYGTLLGQYLMRQRPASVRAVILDAVLPTTFSLLTDTPFVSQRIADKYFRGCAGQAACAAAFPSLGPRVIDLLDRLDREPVVLTTYDLEDEEGETYRVKLTGELLADLVYGALYSPEAQPAVPLVLDQAAKGDFSLVETALLPGAFFDRESAEGMYHTVVCAERGDADPDGIDYPGVAPRTAERGRRDARDMLALCRDWGIELLPRDVIEPVRSDIPTLLLSGNFDPITPPSSAAQVADTLTHAYQVAFPGGSHGQAFGEACATDIIRRFLSRPDEAPDASCAREAVASYLVPSDLVVLPAVRGFVTGVDDVLISRRLLLAWGALLALATTLVVYPVGWVLRKVRGVARPEGSGTAAFSRWAPWLAAATFLSLAAFTRLLEDALSTAAETSPALLYLGAILREDRWIFLLASLGAVLAFAMALVALALWSGDRRSPAGRVYYSVLAVAALAAVWSLWRLGLLWPSGLA